MYYQKNRKRLIAKQNEYRLNNLEEDKRRKREYGRKNRSYLSVWTRDYVQRKREEVIKKLGGKCKCGQDDIRVLEINHKKVKTKTGRRDWMKKGFDLRKVEVLCANCHAIEHYEFHRVNTKKYV